MIHFLKDNTCCQDGGGDGPEGKDCLSKWKRRLETVSNKYNISSANTIKAHAEYQSSLAWQMKLKNWNDIIKETDENADAIVKELSFFIEQTGIVCDNSAETVKAFKRLLGLVKSIFDTFYDYNGEKGLKHKIIGFKKEIECLKNVSEEDKAEVIQCIEVYEEKIIMVCDMTDTVLKQLLETFKYTNLLHSSIGGCYGLEAKLDEMLDVFEGSSNGGNPSYAATSKVEKEEDSKEKSKGRKKPILDNNYSYPCNDVVVQPMPQLPINQSYYYIQIEQDLERALHKTESLKNDWIDCKKVSDKHLSERDSLREAIKNAESAESTK
ncbi:hypothetical protein [Aquimarina algicola]|uniref:Uncharacterized protein n=1 Tax=Aquimarina algicola TaxID=2589995 RepID=A0A504J0L7_9FLAO|nr:hypothetical protein [Aquimarina algicola]TPN83954.1 hypothetical protein FHK87_18490 [Aquimarina algicola]